MDVDARKTLVQLHTEWDGCTKCPLGVSRVAMRGLYVAGEGAQRGVYFLTAGPSRQESEEGRPWQHPANRLVLRTLKALGFTAEDIYVSHATGCRSCTQATDGGGHVVLRENRMTGKMEPVWRDDVPTPAALGACKPRTLEEIYLVDPVLVVTLGESPMKQLLGSTKGYKNNIGKVFPLEFPGAGIQADLTEKGRKWARRVAGNTVFPVKPNMVEYRVFVGIDPRDIQREWIDQGHDNILRRFVEQMHVVYNILQKHRQLTTGVVPLRKPVSLAQIEVDLRKKEAEHGY